MDLDVWTLKYTSKYSLGKCFKMPSTKSRTYWRIVVIRYHGLDYGNISEIEKRDLNNPRTTKLMINLIELAHLPVMLVDHAQVHVPWCDYPNSNRTSSVHI